jgi:hypothetical protein
MFSVLYHECVLFPSASIMGPPEQYVNQGSTVTLTCVVPAPYSHGTRPPRVVDWFHSDRLVTIQVQRHNMEKVTHTNFLYRSSKWRDVYLFGTKHLIYARQVCIAAFIYVAFLYVLLFFIHVFPLTFPSFLSLISYIYLSNYRHFYVHSSFMLKTMQTYVFKVLRVCARFFNFHHRPPPTYLIWTVLCCVFCVRYCSVTL